MPMPTIGLNKAFKAQHNTDIRYRILYGGA